jgi:O-methyltransferase
MHDSTRSLAPTPMGDDPLTVDPIAADLYLDLLKRCLTRTLYDDPYKPIALPRVGPWRAVGLGMRAVQRALGIRGWELVQQTSSAERVTGGGWFAGAETMVGVPRLNTVQRCVTDVLQQGIPGDLIETGVWRGGTTIFMRAVLKVYGDTQRRVWVADSFRGLPRPNVEQYPADAGLDLWQYDQLAIPVEQVKANFNRYGLLDEQVRFLVGWFRDTLPTAPIERLAFMRLDGDLYESTMDALTALYPKLSVGGYVIIDDYKDILACKQAVTDYRSEHGITEPIREDAGVSGVYWQRTS